MRYLIVLAGGCVLCGVASAQLPGQGLPGTGYGQGGYGQMPYGPAVNPNNFMPNIYNPATQPLSPYLNLLRGGNAGVNYYYGVRPGTMGGGMRGGGAPFIAAGGYRPPFFPQLMSAPDPLQESITGPGNVLPPAGHPVVYGNTLGFFPSPFGQAGGSRAGLAGIGAGRSPARK